MTNPQTFQTGKRLKSPRAAAIAGILFALLYGASLVLIRLSIPADLTGDSTFLETNATRIILGLNLMPYAGIAFLWFIGVIRDRLSDQEDRLFATVFLGSGLLFLALTFVGAALASGLISSYMLNPSALSESGVVNYGRSVMYQIVNVYGLRMAGVFMLSLGTIWLRTGVMRRGWTFLTYALALILLVSINFSLWLTLIFPIWVLAVSVHTLILNLRPQSQEMVSET